MTHRAVIELAQKNESRVIPSVDLVNIRSMFHGMTLVNWHLSVTLESSTQEEARQVIQTEHRSVSSYLRILIEKDIAERNKNDARRDA